MTEFLRSNRYASVLITTMLLVVIGVVANVVRDDTPRDGTELRADEQSVQSGGQPTATLPPAIGATPATRLPASMQAPGLTVPGAVKPSGAKPSTGGQPTATTPAGPTETPVTTTPPISSSPFSPGRIAYSAGGRLWTVNPDGTEKHNFGVAGYFPAWTRDYAALAFSDADNPGGALSVLTSSGELRGLTTGVVDDAQPTWSPDGSRLAFARIDNTASADSSAIWIVNRDGSGLRKIATPSPCFSRDPAWSPDGKKIAFWSSRDHCGSGPNQGDYELYVVDVATDDVTRVDEEHVSNASAPAWSPDGNTIVYACDGEGGLGFEICKMDSDGTGKVRITNVRGDDTDPSFSPDGRSIVFRSDRNGGGIFTMKSDGSDVKLLVAGATQPAWS